MAERKKKDGMLTLTEGPIAPKLMRFAMPIILGNLVQ